MTTGTQQKLLLSEHIKEQQQKQQLEEHKDSCIIQDQSFS
jgi:hypothetical protein